MNEFKDLKEKISLNKLEYIKKNSKIPIDEHKQFGFYLFLIKQRLWNKCNYKSKSECLKEFKIIKQIDGLIHLLDNEFFIENPDYINGTPNPYWGMNQTKAFEITTEEETGKITSILDEFPVLKGFKQNIYSGELSVWCPECKQYHYHGPGEGHRGAHCANQNSKYLKGGYIIKYFTKTELKPFKKHILDLILTDKEKQKLLEVV